MNAASPARILHDLRLIMLIRRAHGSTPAGFPLPPGQFRMGGANFQSDEDFLQGALRDVVTLETYAGLSAHSEILDLGCGAGRLAIGLLERYQTVRRYLGLDVQRHLVQWASRFLGHYRDFSFEFLDVRNDRYNPSGETAPHIPARSSTFDVIYAYSVFSHLPADQTRHYLTEISRVLRPSGCAFFTAFVEEGDFAPRVNPTDYGALTWEGPLHCVLLSARYLDVSLKNAGLVVKHISHGTETDGQSFYVVAHR